VSATANIPFTLFQTPSPTTERDQFLIAAHVFPEAGKLESVWTSDNTHERRRHLGKGMKSSSSRGDDHAPKKKSRNSNSKKILKERSSKSVSSKSGTKSSSKSSREMSSSSRHQSPSRNREGVKAEATENPKNDKNTAKESYAKLDFEFLFENMMMSMQMQGTEVSWSLELIVVVVAASSIQNPRSPTS
jgi:hypothetical protein